MTTVSIENATCLCIRAVSRMQKHTTLYIPCNSPSSRQPGMFQHSSARAAPATGRAGAPQQHTASFTAEWRAPKQPSQPTADMPRRRHCCSGTRNTARMPDTQRGDEPRKVRVKLAREDGHGIEHIMMPERRLVVIVCNGSNHYMMAHASL